MSEYVYRFYYQQRGCLIWEHEDYYTELAREAAWGDACGRIQAWAFDVGEDEYLPDVPFPDDIERID